MIQKVSYEDNPFCTAEVLKMAEESKLQDYQQYLWIWGGDLKPKNIGLCIPDYVVIPDISLDSLPFRTAKSIRSYGAIISRFESIHGKGAIFCGCDTGHAGSATHVVLGWLVPKWPGKTGKVIILDEYSGIRKSPTELAVEIHEELPILKDKKICIWIDAAATGDLQTFVEHGFVCKPAPKWPNSEDHGLRMLQGATIEICERNRETIRQLGLFRWKVDTNDQPTGEPESKNDHAADSLRYGIHKWIRNKGQGYKKLKNPYI